jgi:hypothetical protein
MNIRPAHREDHRVEVFSWATDDDPERAVEKAAVDSLAAVVRRTVSRAVIRQSRHSSPEVGRRTR